MKIIRTLIIAFLFASIGQLSMAQTTNVEPFEKLEIAGNITAEVVLGDKEGVEIIEIAEKFRDDLIIKVSGRTLSIYIDHNWKRRNEGNIKATLKITYKSLQKISLSTGADVNVKGIIKTDEFSAEASTSSHLVAKVEAQKVYLDVSTSGRLDISGKTTEQESQASTSGDIDAYELDCQKTIARANTSGSVKINGGETLDAHADTGGKVRFKGEPLKQKISTNTGGKVNKSL